MARLTALTALERCRRGGAWPDQVISACAKKNGLDGRETALASRLCLGVLQNSTLLDFYISQWSSVRLAALEPKVLDILRLSAYQIVFLDAIPAYSAVSEGVELCKRLGYGRASGLVNAVLRRIAENKNNLPEPPGRGSAAYLAARYSHPQWLAEELIHDRGYAAAEAFFAANNAIPPLTAQVNTLKTTAAALAEALAGEGVTAEAHPFLPDCLILSRAGDVSRLESFKSGLFWIQDAAANIAVRAAAPAPGSRLLDICAAPGGKSFAAAALMEGSGSVMSTDISAKKLDLVSAGARRLGMDIISCRPMDASAPEEGLFAAFDTVIADAPCSGMGVIRKKPDIRSRRREELARLPGIQLAVLRGAARCVAPGGTLLYSTCTVRREENEGVVEAFLAAEPDFALSAPSLPMPEAESGGMFTFWPQEFGTDGFFLCRMRRI